MRTGSGGDTLRNRTIQRSGRGVLDRLADRGSGTRRCRAADHDVRLRPDRGRGAVGAFHLDLAIQLVAFVVAVGAGLGIVRPIAIRHIKQPPALRTGAAALVGRSAIVLEEVNEHSGRVRIEGEEWSSRPYLDESLVIPVGAKVDVMQIKGATALVYPRE
jgi:membrane protein implicated in regulation of membrane protease activity